MTASAQFGLDFSKGYKNAHSRRAFAKAKSGREVMYAAILRLLEQRGMTCKELCAELGKQMHSVSGRLSELQHQGKIYQTAERRDKGGVWRRA